MNSFGYVKPILLPISTVLAAMLLEGVGCELGNGSADPPKVEDLRGTWVLVGVPDQDEAHPAAGQRLKFFGDGYWAITQPETDSGRVRLHHGGAYSVTGDTLTKHVDFAIEGYEDRIGGSNHFEFQVEDGVYTQLGLDNSFDEVWKRPSDVGIGPGPPQMEPEDARSEPLSERGPGGPPPQSPSGMGSPFDARHPDGPGRPRSDGPDPTDYDMSVLDEPPAFDSVESVLAPVNEVAPAYVTESFVVEGYGTIAEAQIETGAFEDALDIADKVEELVSSFRISGAPFRIPSEIRFAVVEAQIEAGKLNEAQESARLIESPTLRSRAAVALALVGAVEEAMETAGAIENPLAKESAYSEFALALAEAGHLEKAEGILTQVKEMYRPGDSLRAKVYHYIARAEARAGNIDEAKNTAAAIDGPRWKADAYQEIALAKAQAGDVEEAKATLAEARQITASLEDVRIRGIQLRGIVEDQLEIGALEDAKETASAIDRDLMIWRETYQQLAESQIKAGALDAAKETAEAMPLVWDSAELNGIGRTGVYGAIAAAYADAGDTETAETILEKAEEAVENIEMSSLRQTPYRELAQVHTNMDDMDKARAMLRKARGVAGGNPGIYLAAIAVEQAEAGAFEDAMETAAQIWDLDYWQARAFVEVAKVQLESGELQRTEAALTRAREAAPDIDRTLVDPTMSESPTPAIDPAKTYRRIAALKAEMGDFEGLTEWYEGAEDPRIKLNILLGAAKGLVMHEDA